MAKKSYVDPEVMQRILQRIQPYRSENLNTRVHPWAIHSTKNHEVLHMTEFAARDVWRRVRELEHWKPEVWRGCIVTHHQSIKHQPEVREERDD